MRAEITVPGSKSITNRALVLAALAQGEVTLRGALWSEDTQIMVECLHQLGKLARDVLSGAGIKSVTFIELFVPFLILGFKGRFERLGQPQ